MERSVYVNMFFFVFVFFLKKKKISIYLLIHLFICLWIEFVAYEVS